MDRFSGSKSNFTSGTQISARDVFTQNAADMGQSLARAGLRSGGLQKIDKQYGDMMKEMSSPQALFSAMRTSRFYGQQEDLGAKYTRMGIDAFSPMAMPAPFQGKMQELLSKYAISPGGMPGLTQGGTNAGMASLGGDWAGVDQWNNQIQAAANKYGVPANLIKAVMKLESGGVNVGRNGAGAIGLMQVTDTNWSGLGYDLYQPDQNIMAGAAILQQMFSQCGSWEGAVSAYYTGGCKPTGARDDPAQGGSGMTDYDYIGGIINDWRKLDGSAGGTVSGSAQLTPTNGVSLNSFTGGNSYPISQELGPTDFSMGAGSSMYGYGAAYGVEGHPGIDIGVPMNTQITTPYSGTVVCVGDAGYGGDYGGGGCGYYADDAGGVGRVQIKLDNGDHIIFGHLHSSSLQPGQRVNAGTIVGLSGTAGTGAHVHVEYRKKGANTSSGYQVVDPRTMSGMNVSGGTSVNGNSSTGSYSSPFGTPHFGTPSWMSAYSPGRISGSRGLF